MGALSKSFSPFYKATSIFLSRVLPEALRLMVLTLCVLWTFYRRECSKNEYLAMINKKCSMFVFRRKIRKSEDQALECSICLSEFEEGEEGRELQCKHIFHKNCLQKWLEGSQATCPLCRSKLLPEETVLKYKTLQSEHFLSSYVEEELALLLLSTMQGGSCGAIF